MLLLDEAGQPWSVAAHRRAVADVSGAGDAVIGVAALALAGGLVCESVGVVPIAADRLRAEAVRLGIWPVEY